MDWRQERKEEMRTKLINASERSYFSGAPNGYVHLVQSEGRPKAQRFGILRSSMFDEKFGQTASFRPNVLLFKTPCGLDSPAAGRPRRI